MPKNKSEVEKQYLKQERRIKRAIRELTNQGYIIEYELPSRPKKFTKKSVEKLSKVSRTTIRKKSHYVSPETGEYKSAEKAFKERRSEAGKKAAQTRKANKEKQYKSFERTYFPAEDDVLINNFIRRTGKFFFSPTDLENILDTIFTAPNDPRWIYGRSKNPEIRRKAIEASQKASNALANYIQRVLQADTEIYLDISKEFFSEALERTLFGYSEQEVKLGFNNVMRYLGENIQSAEELQDEDEYIDI